MKKQETRIHLDFINNYGQAELIKDSENSFILRVVGYEAIKKFKTNEGETVEFCENVNGVMEIEFESLHRFNIFLDLLNKANSCMEDYNPPRAAFRMPRKCEEDLYFNKKNDDENA